MVRDDPTRNKPQMGTRYADRVIRAPRGTELSAKSWLTEAPLRMLMNNLDPEVAENPKELVVYGGIGRAARNWECYDAIVAALRELGADESLLVQSGKPVAVFKTHPDAPRVLIANSNLVPKWSTWECVTTTVCTLRSAKPARPKRSMSAFHDFGPGMPGSTTVTPRSSSSA